VTQQDTLLGAPGARLRSAWQDARGTHPQARVRDIAAILGVPEASLVASQVGESARRLGTDFAALIRALPTLGEVMVLTRNQHCVHEKVGTFGRISIPGHIATVTNGEVDLRIFLNHWQHGFALAEALPEGKTRRSLQFFDAEGVAVHKIYARADTDLTAWEALVAAHLAPVQDDSFAPVALPAPAPLWPDAEIDVAALRQDWLALQDTHDFARMLRTHKAGRHQALRLVGEDLAFRLAPAAPRALLEAAADSATPIMVFTRNRGCIQIHTGPVHSIKVTGPWVNVLDARFDLHLREDAVAEAWVVRKPTRDGWLTSVELYDSAQEYFTLFFGGRKPGQPELEGWRGIVASLAKG
jgi:putative hemin transport protein